MEEILFPDRPVLMVDDEIHLLHSFDLALGDAGINNTVTCNDSTKVMELLKGQKFETLLLDLSMPKLSGEEILEKVTVEYPELPVIIITGHNEIEVAVRCMKKGAFDYLSKPVEESRLINSVRKALEIRKLRNENYLLRNSIFSEEIKNPEVFKNIITHNDKMKSIFSYMEAVSVTNEPILITGETGVGKDLVAKAIHKLSEREGDYISTNVAGLDDQMFADTLFGHKKGAFTNAITERDGLIEKASGGTLFLDEIGDLSMTSQVKLLRLVQEQEYYQLGADDPKYTDARIIVATNQDLYKQQEKGEFRKDLFYRLNVHHIHIPPLRKRKNDIPLLVEYFLDLASQKYKKKKPTVPPELITLLSNYTFPGNIRELQGMVFDAMSLHKSRTLSLDSFKRVMDKNKEFSGTVVTEYIDENEEQNLIKFANHNLPTLKQAQALLIKEALKRAKNNQTIAAQLLGVTRQALSQRLKTGILDIVNKS